MTNAKSQYSSSSSSSSRLSSSTISSSTGSSPTTSKSVPHSSQDTISPLSVSKSTWTSASHSGQVPVGTCFRPPPHLSEGRVNPSSGEHRALYATKSIYPRALEFATIFFSVLHGPLGCHKGTNFLFLFAKFSTVRHAKFVVSESAKTDLASRNSDCGFPHL